MATTRAARAVTLAHRDQLLRLREVSGNGISQAWLRFGNVDTDDQFLSRASGLVTATRESTAQLAFSYVSAYGTLEGAQLDIDPEVITAVVEETRGGVPVEEVYHRPQVAARSILAGGGLWRDAMEFAAKVAARTLITDVALVNRAALDAAADRLNPQANGWVRIAGPTACGFCAKVAGQIVSRPNIAPLHPYCSCTLEPGAFKLNTKRGRGRYVDVPRTKALDNSIYAVEQHGELGPIPVRVPESQE